MVVVVMAMTVMVMIVIAIRTTFVVMLALLEEMRVE